MIVEFDEMPGLELLGSDIAGWYVYFQDAFLGSARPSDGSLCLTPLFETIPPPEQLLISSHVSNYFASQRVAKRLKT